MRERPSGITVDVTRSTEAIDFDADVEHVSEAMGERILAHLRARIDKNRGSGIDYVGGLIVGVLAEATEDARAETLFRLLHDYEAHGGERSAIGKVLSGEVDLVQLVADFERTKAGA